MNAIIGNNLRLLRTANSFTQQQIADFLEIKRSAYSNYESGEREMPLDRLERVATLYGCELSDLLSDDQRAIDNMLICAFRIDDLNVADLNEIASFKSIVMNYLKMNNLLNNETER